MKERRFTSLEDTRRKTRIIFVFEQTFEYFVSILMTGGFLSVLLSRNGVPDWLVGIVSSFITMTCIFQIFSASIVKSNTNIKRLLFNFTLTNELIFTFLYVIPVFPIPKSVKCASFVILIFVAYAVYNLAHPLKFSWYTMSIDPDKRGSFTAKKEMTSLILGMGFSFGMGTLSDFFTERGEEGTAFLITALTLFIVSLVHLILILSTKGESLQVSGGRSGFQTLVKSFKKLGDKTIFPLVLIDMLWKSAICISTVFYGVYQTNDLGMTLQFITVLSIVQAAARTLSSLFMGRIADRLGWHIALSMCFASALIAFVFVGFCNETNGVEMFILYSVFFGIAMSGINSGLMNIVFDYVPTEECASILGLKSSISGLMGFGVTTLAGAVLARIQKNGGVEIFSHSLRAQQVLSFVSALFCIVLIAILLLAVRKLKRNR